MKYKSILKYNDRSQENKVELPEGIVKNITSRSPLLEWVKQIDPFRIKEEVKTVKTDYILKTNSPKKENYKTYIVGQREIGRTKDVFKWVLKYLRGSIYYSTERERRRC